MSKILQKILDCPQCEQRYGNPVFMAACSSVAASHDMPTERLMVADLIFYHNRDHIRPSSFRGKPGEAEQDLRNTDLQALDG
jgi:hypothetical protein